MKYTKILVLNVISLKAKRKLTLLSLIIWDILSVFLSIVIGLRLRFGLTGSLPKRYLEDIGFYFIIITLVTLLANMVMHCYGTIWRYFSHKDFLRQILSVLISAIFIVLIDTSIGLQLPDELFILIPSLMVLLMVFGRFVPRAYHNILSNHNDKLKKTLKVRTLIYGAGEAGNYLISSLTKNEESNIIPVGFIDDDESLVGLKIGKVPIIATGESLEFVLADLNAKELIIAMPTAQPKFVKEIYMRCNNCGVIVKRYGSLTDVTNEDFQRTGINKINFEDLLRRESVTLNMNVVRNFIKHKTILVTGGVGSIGSEICRQVLKFGCDQLVMFDINENGLFYMKNELDNAGFTGRFVTLLGSIRDRNRLTEIFAQYHPVIVFHAAAHKHVPMMEDNPKESIKNNVLGTINVANEAIFHKVEKFILISTDKAVNPTNIMGASKRIAEMAIQIMNEVSDTDFAAVRFGNVLGSNGSVVPFFNKQIEDGGPVTVTHPEMKRYFMTIPEAVQLVLEAGAMADGGEIFVLDMGKPVLIYDLACDLIRLHGLIPDIDIPIKFTGLRPGEKLFEEISLADEDTTKTPNDKIFICKPTKHSPTEFSHQIKRLEKIVKTPDIDLMFSVVKELVKTFHHNDKATNTAPAANSEFFDCLENISNFKETEKTDGQTI